MKKQKIYDLFKKDRHLKLYNKLYDDNGDSKVALQYITNGAAFYPLENLPVFDKDTLRGLLNIDPNMETEYIVDVATDWLLEAVKPFADNEIPLKKSPYNIFGYTVFETYHNTDNDDYADICVFVNPKYLAPIDDDGTLNYSYRKICDKLYAVIVTDGMIVNAIILPATINKDGIPKAIDFTKMVYAKLMEMQSAADTNGEDDHLEL